MRVVLKCSLLFVYGLLAASPFAVGQTMSGNMTEGMSQHSPTMAPAAEATASAAVAAQAISPKSVYVHIGQTQKFVSDGATNWTTTAGKVTLGGLFTAPSTMPKSNIVTVTAIGPGGSAAAKVVLVSGVLQTISPASASLNVGVKQQFTSAGATQWSAVYGTISSTGLYTAPAVWPSYGTDTISVYGPQGSATATVTLLIPTPVVTRVGSAGQIPFGLFTVTVGGTGFNAASVATLNKTTLSTTYANGELTVTGFAPKTGAGTLTVSNHTVVSNVFPVTVGVAKPKASPAAARRILEQGAFGPTPADAEYVQAIGIPAWIQEQFKTTWVSNYNGVTSKYGGMPNHFLTNAVTNPDQLRQRVAFALSQIFVTSLEKGSNETMIPYQNMLLTDAFTNYRQIMEDVTLSPAMGQYLDMANNAKANPSVGSVANENYARELMQLFTIGTNMLNADGTLQLDANGLAIPTYSQFTVTEFARVYTGWTYHPAPGKGTQFWSGPNAYGQMVPYPSQHDTGSKQLLSGYVSPAGADPKTDLENALNNIFHHPNVGPFVCKQLIQHLVKSNPSPAYVARVALVFKNNGNAVRGDMKAVINAILTDPEARANDEGGDDLATDGHLQEPALFIAGMVRAFGGQMNDQNYYSWDLQQLGQDIFSPPSVFNYYAPTVVAPGTSILGPEFGIHSPNNAVLEGNEVSNLFSQWSDPVQTYGPGTTVNLAGFYSVASDPKTLVNALDLTLTRGVMPDEMKTPIVTAVTAETGGTLRRIQRACYLILTSGYYNVWH